MSANDPVILGGARTPIGPYGGSLSHIRTDDLLGMAMTQACERSGVRPEQIQEIAAGCVNVAHQGMGDIAHAIRAREISLGLAAGVESMSRSGTRCVLTLATELRERGLRYGAVGVCVGSGQGVALVIENTQSDS